MTASEDEAVTLDAETICHDGKPAGMADPKEGTDLAMTTMRIAAARKMRIAPLAVTMTKSKALAAMTMIHLHEEQKPKLGGRYADDSLIYISYFVGPLYIHVSLSLLF
jgi:hypothetical protein